MVKGGSMFKWFFRIIGIIVLVSIIGYTSLTIAASSSCQHNKAPAEAPSGQVGYLVQTASRVYYTAHVEETSETVILNGYYEIIGNKWVYRDGKLILNRAAYGKITIEEVKQ